MPISILNLAQGPEGASITCDLVFDELEDIDLAEPTKGQVTIYNVTAGSVFHAKGSVRALVNRQCDRCLDNFEEDVEVEFVADFTDQPSEEEWSISDNSLDLTKPVREQILLHIPIKSLCSKDCNGII